MKKVILVFLSFIFAESIMYSQSKTNDLPIIDLSKNYPKKEIILQDIADVEYVSLETTDDVLLCGSSTGDFSVLFHVSDQYICTYELFRGEIFIFNRSGKIVHHFNRKGQSGREYTSIMNVIFDEKNEEIFVCTHYQSILVYTPNGEYKRTLKPIKKYEAYNFDDETLLVFDEVVANTTPQKNPYHLISKKDGSTVDVFDITLPKRYSNVFEIEPGHQIKVSSSNRRYYGNDFVIADMSSDTIFLLTQNKELTPLLARKPSVHASEPRKIWTNILTTDKFILIGLLTLDFQSKNTGGRVPVLMYEFETGEISVESIKNAEYSAIDGWGSEHKSFTIAKNMTAELISISQLKEQAERKMLTKDFAKYVSKLDEDDNPIVRIVTFK